MKKNVGNIDKIVRVIIAVVTGYFAYNGEFEVTWITYLLYAITVIMILTILIGSCPIYSILGIKSNK